MKDTGMKGKRKVGRTTAGKGGNDGAEQLRPPLPDIRCEVGNVLDHWAQLPNDVRFSGDMDALNKAIEQLYNAAGGFTK